MIVWSTLILGNPIVRGYLLSSDLGSCITSVRGNRAYVRA